MARAGPGDNFRHLGHAQYTALSERGRRLARRVALPPGVEQPHYLAHAHSQIVPAEGGERDTSWRELLKLSGQVISGIDSIEERKLC